LLLWDELHVIVPENGFKVSYTSTTEEKAMDLVGRYRAPTDAEKAAAHELIEDFVSRPLPAAFSYADTIVDPYEVYPQKLMMKTWDLLQRAQLVGPALPNQDMPAARNTGLSLMSILADCCAGTQLARVTDQSAAYAFLSDAAVRNQAEQATDEARSSLMSVPLQIAAVDNVPIEKLIALREREKAGKSPGLAALRHRLADKLEEQASALSAVKTRSDHEELTRQFKQFLAEDLRDLREALKLESTEVLTSKVVLGSVLGVLGAFAPVLATMMPAIGLPLAAVAGASGLLKAGAAAGAIGGLLNTKAKFAKTRAKVLEQHPTAYLYEALEGPLRF
jgi:hypothetical protein